MVRSSVPCFLASWAQKRTAGRGANILPPQQEHRLIRRNQGCGGRERGRGIRGARFQRAVFFRAPEVTRPGAHGGRRPAPGKPGATRRRNLLPLGLPLEFFQFSSQFIHLFLDVLDLFGFHGAGIKELRDQV